MVKIFSKDLILQRTATQEPVCHRIVTLGFSGYLTEAVLILLRDAWMRTTGRDADLLPCFAR